MSVLKFITKTILDWKLAIFLVLGILGGLYGWHLVEVQEEIQKITIEIEQKYIAETVVLKEKADKETSVLKAQIEKTQKEKEDEIKANTTKYNDIIISLRNRPSRPSESVLPGNPLDTKSTEGATGLRLFKDDSEFLSRIARDTTRLQTELRGCYKQYDEVKESLDSFRIKNQ